MCSRRCFDVPLVSGAGLASDGVAVFDYDVFGLGLGGFLCPGQMAIVGSRSDRDALAKMIAASATVQGMSYLASLLQLPLNYDASRFWLLGPGDVVQFAEPLDGCVVAPVSFGFTPDVAPSPYPGTPVLPLPFLRVFRQPVTALAGIGYFPTPGSVLMTTGIGSASPLNAADGVPIPPGTRRVVLSFQDNTTLSPTRVVSGESGAYNVWWRPAGSPLWGHNEDDDCDAAGRGEIGNNAGAVHDLETYELDGSMGRLFVEKVSGDNFYCRVTVCPGVR